MAVAAVVSLLCTTVVGAQEPAEKPRVVATIAQIGEPLARIAGDALRVSSLMGPGVDPHLYRPTRSDILALTRADLIVWTGQTLESKMAGAIRRLGRRVDQVALIEHLPPERLLQDADNKRDPHLWMDVGLWRTALDAGVAALMRLAPDEADAIRARADAYFTELGALDAYVRQVMAGVPERRRVLITAHDAFAYFGRAYQIQVEGVQGTSTETEAGLKDIERLVRLIVERDLAAVFAETSVSDRNVTALIEGAAARGHDVVLGGELFSDAMGEPGTYLGTYVGMLDHNGTTIARALGGDPPAGGFGVWRQATEAAAPGATPAGGRSAGPSAGPSTTPSAEAATQETPPF
ncbi:metal ABC transporter solute-binding protein, Zn/Mn family [Rhodothalassium salexigens]|uniref:metal ABC transporter solute-binding protein, Zn/Mn family n=1 Tax=Rhodothalassium salexigens TaxID=1086 RepID=UPI001914A008